MTTTTTGTTGTTTTTGTTGASTGATSGTSTGGKDAVRQGTVSRDGTPIAWWTSGSGPDLLLVHGTTADHTRWEVLAPLLEKHATVHAMDRRGRGSSGDGPAYSLAAEAEDVAAVVAAIGRPVDVFGHSYGALCTLEAMRIGEGMRIGDGMRRVVLYEPPLGTARFPEALDRYQGMLAEGRREELVTAMLSELAGMSDDQLAAARALPSWRARVAAAHTVVREMRAEEDYTFRPERFAGTAPPTLLLDGTESPAYLREATAVLARTLPGARVAPLAGHGHVAMLADPRLVADLVLGHFRDGSG